jgi:hypothetical protein
LYERHGEAAVRSFSQFHPAVTPADVALMAQPPHFLAYLDNLVQSHAEELRFCALKFHRPSLFKHILVVVFDLNKLFLLFRFYK